MFTDGFEKTAGKKPLHLRLRSLRMSKKVKQQPMGIQQMNQMALEEYKRMQNVKK